MHIRRTICLLAVSATAFCQTPGGKVVHDKTNACQLMVPATWTVSSDFPSIGTAPANLGSVQLVSRPGKTVQPMNEMAQQALMVAKMIQNTPQGVLFASQPNKGENPMTSYTAHAPGKNGMCSALFGVRAGVSEETIKKIAASMVPVK